MIKGSTQFFASVVLLAATSAAAGTKMDAYLDSRAPSIQAKASSISAAEGSGRRMDVFIKSAEPARTREAIAAAGGIVRVAVGDIISASIPEAALARLAEGEEVIYMEGAKPLSAKNDVAVPEINAAEVHAGTGLAQALTGKGAIVGLIDTGIDYRQPDFKDEDGANRILAIWDQNRQDGPAPAEIEGSFGTECLADAIADSSCPLGDAEGHGTHVAGTMAGRHPRYGGVAPGANIIAVVYDSSLELGGGYANAIFSSNICQAAYYIFAKARGLGMPAVVNLSLGTHIGPHDGTSLFEQCLGGLVAEGAGRALVAAAGNEGTTEDGFAGIHAGGGVGGGILSAANFAIRRVSSDRIYYIDLWGARGSSLTVGLAMRDGAPPARRIGYSGQVEPGGRSEGSFLDGGVNYLISATETESALNGKQHVGITISLDGSVTSPSRYSFDLVVGGDGVFDAWLFPDKPSRTIQFTASAGGAGAEWNYLPSDRAMSVAIPATSPAIVAVAGYTTRNRWDGGANCCQVAFEVGELLDFSSAGPTTDPASTGVKPDIAAPGGMIASALSSGLQSINQPLLADPGHMLLAGTSMSAPFVSGTAALMLSANPNFTAGDIKRYLIGSAYVDEAVGSVPNDRWGYGKLDSLGAVELALSGGPSGDFSSDGLPTKLLTPAGPAPRGGCEVMAGEALGPPRDASLTFAAGWAAAAFAILILTRTEARRKRQIS